MPLVTCPDCDNPVSTAAAACPQCGRPLGARGAMVVQDRQIVWVAYLLWFFGGFLGLHKFYQGKVGWGVLYIFTGGILGVGWIIDLFVIHGQVRRFNQGIVSSACWG